MKLRLLFLALLLPLSTLQAQSFTHADTLRGMLSPLRSCFDVKWYDLKVKVDPAQQLISGTNVIRFVSTAQFTDMQLDFFAGMNIDKIEYEGIPLTYTRQENAVFFSLPHVLNPGVEAQVKVTFGGRPTRAKNAPWDGGFIWSSDKQNKPWVGVACEGLGASCWWPLKDHLSDEPDSMRITVSAPESLMAVANGQLRRTYGSEPGYTAWEWAVTYPINSYNVTVNIADYAHIHDTYQNASGTHDLDYYVLSYNKAKAIEQFKQVKEMMDCYEKYFGEYPFWRDGYALVETPYLGMEHQSAIAYGNGYQPGYAGYDPLGLGFDYIVIHETGHEWWGNSVSTDDHAELWIHESFCTYGEAVYVECKWNEQKAQEYMNEQRSNIANLDPIVGPRDVNFDEHASSDMYYKGAWMLHSLRHYVNDDLLWWTTVKKFAEEFKYKVTNTDEVIRWFNMRLQGDYTAFFKQFLYQAKLPVFEYHLKKKGKRTLMTYRWNNAVQGFAMPVDVVLGSGAGMRISPGLEWQKTLLNVPPASVQVDTDHFLFKPVKISKL